MFLFHWFYMVFRRALESIVWSLEMSDLEIVDISFGLLSIMEQMLDHHGFCELEIVDLSLVLY